LESKEQRYKKVLFIPGFLRDEGRVARVSQILEHVQPLFNKEGWEIVVSNYYQGQPTDRPLEIYAGSVYADIFYGEYRAIIAHSMGGLLLPENIQGNIPVIIIESPWYGVLKWQFWVINLLARLKGEGGFPLDSHSVQGMIRNSKYMNQKKLSPAWASRALQINGQLGTWLLARIGNTFGKIPRARKYKEFPKIGHINLLTDPEVIQLVLDFLNSDTKIDALISLEK
jgi:triacylglycerol esterase/lipase EstA (alpha/beta hydrolase family)